MTVVVNEPATISVVVRGPIARPDLPGLCGRVSDMLVRTGATVVSCDVCGVDPDVASVDAIARIRVVARQHGCELRLHGASADLRDLLAFLGLREILLR
jgi:ABC-type transporter Mla MlaB component